MDIRTLLNPDGLVILCFLVAVVLLILRWAARCRDRPRILRLNFIVLALYSIPLIYEISIPVAGFYKLAWFSALVLALFLHGLVAFIGRTFVISRSQK